MFCWLYFIQAYVVLKTETGSASGPALFTSCKMVYIFKSPRVVVCIGLVSEHTEYPKKD